MTKVCQKCGNGYEWSYLYANLPIAQKCPYCSTPYPTSSGLSPSTQKAKGIYALLYNYSPTIGSCLSPYTLFKVKEDLPELGHLQSHLSAGSIFARPCPPSPEHGFVESRVVKSIQEIEDLRQETLKANPDSEILLVPLIDATSNIVWTPSLMAVGKGHDGATSGKGAISFPLSGIHNLDDDLIHKKAGVKEGAAPYIEAIFGKTVSSYAYYSGGPTLVQLRGGPALAPGLSADVVSEETTVVEVIRTNGEDLLEWAKVIRGIKGKPGIVVYHPGGTPVDHYSVHCRENGVPIVTSFEPHVGEVLQPTGKVEDLDPDAVIEGLATGDLCDTGENGDMGRMYGYWTALALLANHSSGVLRGKDAFWIGVGAAALIKLGSSALNGESRHAHNLPGKWGKPDIYGFYGKKRLSFHRARLSRVTQLLHYGFGPVDVSHGFGGPKWSLCGAALCPMFNAIRNLVLEPTSSHASDLLTAMNIAINQAHNGGWWLNKFVDGSAFKYIPEGRPEWAIMAAPAILRAGDLREAGKAHLEAFTKQVKNWPETSIHFLKWRKASLDIGPGSFVIDLKPATVPTNIRIQVPLTKVQIDNLINEEGQVAIEDGKVALTLPDGKSITLWAEKGIVARERNPNDRSTW